MIKKNLLSLTIQTSFCFFILSKIQKIYWNSCLTLNQRISNSELWIQKIISSLLSISLPLPSNNSYSFPASSMRLPPGSKRNRLQTICLQAQHMPPLVTREKEKSMCRHNRPITGANCLPSSFPFPPPYIKPDAGVPQVGYCQYKWDKENQLVATEQTLLKQYTKKLNSLPLMKKQSPGNVKKKIITVKCQISNLKVSSFYCNSPGSSFLLQYQYLCTVYEYVWSLISYLSSVCFLTMAPLAWLAEFGTLDKLIGDLSRTWRMEDEACMIQTMGPACMNTDSTERWAVHVCLFQLEIVLEQGVLLFSI